MATAKLPILSFRPVQLPCEKSIRQHLTLNALEKIKSDQDVIEFLISLYTYSI